MSTVKKYQPGEGWESIASDDAGSIYTNHPLLTKTENSTCRSVEEILVNQQTDINLLKKNVSWLALHGGGGYGGGGGNSSDNSAKVIIISPIDGSEGIKELVWSGITAIRFKISSRSSSVYSVVVKVNGVTKYTASSIPKNTTRDIPSSLLGIGKNSVTLQIYAYDENNNEYSESCSILVPSIDLLTSTNNYLIVQSDIPNLQETITLSYRVSIPGKRYYLLYSTRSITLNKEGLTALYNSGNYIDLGEVVDTGWKSKQVDLKSPAENRPILEDNQAVGTYPVQFVLAMADNFSIFSKQVSISISVILTTGIAIIPSLGLTNDNPHPCQFDSTLSFTFTVIGNDSGTYEYDIFYKTGEDQLYSVSSGNASMGAIVPTNINFASLSGTDIEERIGQTVEFIISVTSARGHTASASVYIMITTASTERLERYLDLPCTSTETYRDRIVFDYTMENYGNPFGDSSISEVILDTYDSKCNPGNKTKLTFYQVGADTVHDGRSVYLNHRAYAEITIDPNNTLIRKWFPESSTDQTSFLKYNDPEFTFEIAFWIDNVGDNSTILSWGSLTSNNELGTGILIKSDSYKVRFFGKELSGELQENNFYHICVQVRNNNNNKKDLIVYKNGLYDSAEDISINTFSISSAEMGKIIIGKENTGNFTNTRLFSVKLSGIAYNIGQIICSYINNVICCTEGTGKNVELFLELLNTNFIRRDSEIRRLEEEGQTNVEISQIYSFRDKIYNWGINDLTNITGSFQIPPKIENITIPVVLISTNWTYEDFSSTSTKAPKDETAHFRYYDPNTKNLLGAAEIDLSIQGTTTSGYTIKNLQIDFQNNRTFSPKSTWYPENSFTLKADVVDSGHYNNAVIGKFVNDCYNNSSYNLMNTSSATFPAKTIFSNNSNYLGEITSKTCIEGFPVILFVGFNQKNIDTGESYGSGSDVRCLGIYSFNLGRASKFNQGLEIPTRVYSDPNSSFDGKTSTVVNKADFVFPGYYGVPAPEGKNTSYAALCFEGVDTKNWTTKPVDINKIIGESDDSHIITTLTGTNGWKQYYLDGHLKKGEDGYAYCIRKNSNSIVKDKSGNYIPWDSEHVSRLQLIPTTQFWGTSVSKAYSNKLWSLEFRDGRHFTTETTSWPAATGNTPRNHLELLGNFIFTGLPYTKGNVVYNRFPSFNYNDDGDPILEYGPDGNVIINYVNIAYPQAQTEPQISIRNTAFYYVISLLFGLIDSLGKNMQMKVWIPEDSGSKYMWSPTFYDMDTALGLSNTGDDRVPSDVLDYFLANDPENNVYSIFALHNDPNEAKYNVTGNKLWGFDDKILDEKYLCDISPTGDSFCTTIWNQLRRTILPDANTFIKKYVEPQMKGCSLFAMNLDFETKYLNTAQKTMLHGTRLDKIKHWLTERIAFLDSVFEFQAHETNENELDYLNLASYYEVPINDTISIENSSSAQTIPITLKSSAIVITEVGKRSKYRKFIKGNTRETLRVSSITADSNTGNTGIQVLINNTSLITDIDLKNQFQFQKIVEMSRKDAVDESGTPYADGITTDRAYYNYGNFRNLKVWDLQRVQTISENIDLFNLFKSWDSSYLGIAPTPFLLQEINYESTRGAGSFSLDLNGSTINSVPSVYTNPFTNLIKINISNSNLRDISIPNSISLAELKLDNSYIQSISLERQPLLEFPEDNSGTPTATFPGCSYLKTIKLVGCKKLKGLILNSSNKSVSSIEISGCENLEIIDINGNFEYIPKIQVQSCSKLRTINIKNCYSTSEENLGEIYITGCPNISTVSLVESHYSKVEINPSDSDDLEKFITVSLTFTKLPYLNTFSFNSGTIDNCINLKKIEQFSNLKFNTCPSISSIKFAHNTIPVTLPNESTFSYCNGLTQITGHLRIKSKGTFTACPNLDLTSCIDSLGNSTNSTYPFSRTQTSSSQYWYTYNANRKLNIVITNSGAQNLCYGIYNESDKRGPKLNKNVVLYLLGNIDTTSVTSISNMFYHSTGTNILSTITTAEQRTLFRKCGNVTTASNLFFSTSLGSYSLLSPNYDRATDQITSDDGIFSPLVNCTTFDNWGLTGSNSTCNRWLLRRKNGTYKFTKIEGFNPKVSDGDITNFFKDCPNVKTIGNSFNIDDAGFTLNYSNNPKLPLLLTEIVNSFNARGLGEEFTLENFFNFEEDIDRSELELIRNSFVIILKSSKVTFRIKRGMFRRFPSLTKLLYYYGYDDGSSSSNLYTSTSTPFRGSGMNKVLSFDPSVDGLKDILNNNSNWVNIDGLFLGCTWDTELYPEGTEIPVIDLPGNLFEEQSKLTTVRSCFQSVKFDKIELSGEGFKGCPNLVDVSYLFANIPTEITIPNRLFYLGNNSSPATINKVGINGEIRIKAEESDSSKFRYWYLVIEENNSSPEKFILDSDINTIKLNTTLATVDQESLNELLEINENNELLLNIPENLEENSYEFYNIEGDCIIKIEFKLSDKIYKCPSGTTAESGLISPVVRVTSEGETNQIQVGNINDNGITVKRSTLIETYPTVIKKLSKYTGCFSGCSHINYYVHTYRNDDIEVNPNYQPYKYIITSSVWKETTVSPKYTLEWVYDGNKNTWENSPVVSSVSSDLLIPEDPVLNNSDNIVGGNYRSGYIITEEGDGLSGIDKANFMCPPDLLRYSADTSSININYLFEDCGYAYPKGNTNAVPNVRGVRGRLCPYLLKPTSKIINLVGIFMNCRWLGYYTVKRANDVRENYVIPENFFNYLQHNNIIDLSYLFSGISFPKGKVGIKLPSNTKKINHMFYNCSYLGTLNNKTNISNVFTNVQEASYVFAMSSHVSNNSYGQQYVEFQNIFSPSITGNHVFFNYVENYVTHEDPKTCSTNPGSNNYAYYGHEITT